MHQPKPYGLLVKGGELVEDDETFIHHELQKLTNQKQVSELDNLRWVKYLPSGNGYVILQDMAGILKAIVQLNPKEDEKFKPDDLAKLYVPMLYSGVVTKARVRRATGEGLFGDDVGEGVKIKLTEQARRRIANYVTENIADKEMNFQRFIIEPNEKVVPEFIPRMAFDNPFVTTQYVQQRPTWYSGAMAEVMQIVGGYGRQDVKAFVDTAYVQYDKAQFEIPLKYLARINDELEGVRLPAYTGIPPIDGKFQYDYKFKNCHVVSFDENNEPWLVQINPLGVYAMPLPIVPATATAAFREYIEEVGDDEILKILDRFGAMPSGEGFPTGTDFEAWRRAGVVIKVCDTADFYHHLSYSQTCGWSFNLNGTEGFNTCYSYDEDGIAVGKAFKINLKLAGVVGVRHTYGDGEPVINFTKKGWGLRQTIAKFRETYNYLKLLFDGLTNYRADEDNGQRKINTLAIMYKLRGVSPMELRARSDHTNIYLDLQGEIDYWDNFEIAPLAPHTGQVRQVGQGYLYHYQKPEFQPQIKFPMVESGGCISFDFSVLDKSKIPEGNIVRCDTIMYGYYVEDQLKVVKYFIDNRTFTKEVQSTFEDIMIVGQWEKTETTGSTGLMGYFYTSDFDDRREVSESTIYTHIKGSDLGYGNPAYQTPHLLYTHGGLSRSRYYKHETTIKTESSNSLDVAICVPVFNRDAILYAYKESTENESLSEKHTRHSIADPTSYPLWTYDPVFYWIGSFGKGKPTPKTGEYVYVYGPPKYNPNDYSDFADSGDWFGVGSSYIDVSSVCAPYTSRASGDHQASGVVIGGEGPTIEPYDKTETVLGKNTGKVAISYKNVGAKVAHHNIPDSWYFEFSPVDAGGTPHYFYRDACKVVFGDSEYANISETDQYNRRYKWGHTSLVDHKSAYHFIGVINE